MKGSEKDIKVLFWPGWWYPKPEDPCDGIFIKKHAQAAADYCRVNILYVVRDQKLKDKKYSCATGEESGLFTVRIRYNYSLKGPKVITRILEVFRSFKAAGLGRKLIKEKFGEPDLIHVNVNPPLGIIIYLLTRYRKIPKVFTEHWSGYLPADGSYRGFLRKWIFKKFLRHCRKVTCVSHDLKRAMIRHGLKHSYHIIPNAVDSEIFFPPQNKPPSFQTKTLLHVSNLAPVKNIKGIIRTVRELLKIRQDFQLIIIGYSNYLKKLQHYRDEKKIPDKYIIFSGHQGVEEVAAHMRKSDFLVLFSDFENSPCVIAEALSCGLPVISTDVGGVSEHLNTSNGILIKAGDEQELLNTLNKMLDEYRCYDPQAISRHAHSIFDSKIVGQQFYDLYQSILTKQKK